MQKIEVNAERRYDVLVGCNWQSELLRYRGERARVAVIISSEMRAQVDAIESADSQMHIFEIPDGENGKDSITLESLWNSLGSAGFTRSDLVIAVGGGATTDIAGFAAATWLRGIDWLAIPTTLVGMVDAAIGGKTGMNSKFGKNLIGAFHSPTGVLIDPTWLDSLSDRDFAAGLAEVVKCGFIADKGILDLLTGKSLAQVRNSKQITEELILRSIKVKAEIVASDFKEGFAREILNYGHTMGHAVELHSKYQLRHGEAVAIGMIFAAELAHVQGVLPEDVVALHRSLLSSLGLPTTYPATALPELLPLLAMDKKARGNALRFVAISAIGQTLRLEGIGQGDLQKAYGRLAP